MLGEREEIAKHLVSNILETLTTNDFVNIITFSERATFVTEKEIMVSATLGNIRRLNLAMENIKPGKIANYTEALHRAFQVLRDYRESSTKGAGCNQAIMLISDGVPHDFNETFREYNWPEIHVRLFTYLIGTEVPDFKLIKEMACINQGYYVHLSVLSEVREQVLKYLPVMARPLVLGRSQHPVIWSHVYADVVVCSRSTQSFFFPIHETKTNHTNFAGSKVDRLQMGTETKKRPKRKLPALFARA